ncbi:hypothetical protein SESBI_04860 [Sesbania bispinosa]|nr:hypothetical protein SESBI_04860 [Sesbania bispinosa]
MRHYDYWIHLKNGKSTIGSKEGNREEGPNVIFKRTQEPSFTLVASQEAPGDRRKPILEQLQKKVFTKAIREYQHIRGSLYKRSSNGLLMKFITETEGSKKLESLHQAICEVGGPSLYRRMQRVGVFWLFMKVHCDGTQSKALVQIVRK